MGHIVHDAVLVVTSDYRDGGLPDMDAFRASIPEGFRRLVIGPVNAAINGYICYAWLPDGSKEGWADSDLADEHRARFAALFSQEYSDGSSADDVLEVRFGGDDSPEVSVETRSGAVKASYRWSS